MPNFVRERRHGRRRPTANENPRPLAWIAVWGPGLLVMLADTDAGNVVTAAQSGRAVGLSAAALAAAHPDALHGAGIDRAARDRHRARPWRTDPRTLRLGMGVAVDGGLTAGGIGSLVTEFTGVAGIGELYGLSRGLTLPFAAAALLAVVATGSYRRVERAAIVVGLFERRSGPMPGRRARNSRIAPMRRSIPLAATANTCTWSRRTSARRSCPG